MQLLHSPASPFVRKVRILLREAGGEGRVTEVPVHTTPYQTAPDLAARNPLGKIPALVRDDGPALYDSRVITRFLDHHLGAGLYPEARLWDVLVIEATADGIMDAAVAMTYESRFRGEAASNDYLDAQWTKVSRALDALEGQWMSHLAGSLDMGQIAVASALGYLDLRHGARDWRHGRAALADWHARFEDRPSYAETRPE